MKNLFIALLICLPLVSSASVGYIAENFESSSFNGLYCEAGMQDGVPYYTNSIPRYLSSTNSNSLWMMGTTLITTNTDPWSYGASVSDTHVDTPDTANGNYFQDPYPTPSSGTFTATTCGGGSGTSTTATTSIETLLGTLNFGIAIIITILFLMVVGFMYNNMTRKKPWL